MVMLRRLWIKLTADRKRFATLCIAVCVGMLLWARLIVISNAPRTAIADENVALDDAIEDDATPSDIEKAPIHVVLSERPEQDPFVINPNYFPDLAPVDENAGDQGKSDLQPAEDPELVERRFVVHLRTMVDGFTLEGVMVGANLAVIDGETYRQGDSIVSSSEQIRFTLAEVKERSVILANEDRRFELKMSSPGGE